MDISGASFDTKKIDIIDTIDRIDRGVVEDISVEISDAVKIDTIDTIDRGVMGDISGESQILSKLTLLPQLTQ